MHPQLDLIAVEYRSAQARLHELVRAVPDEQWGRRSDAARWSVAECVAHLNLTSMAYLPLLQHAQQVAQSVIERDPLLEQPEHEPARRALLALAESDRAVVKEEAG